MIVALALELDSLAAVLVAVIAVGTALGIAWPITRSKAVQQRQTILADTNATLQTALSIERAERREDNDRNALAMSDLRTECARETASLSGKVEVLTGQFAAQLAAATVEKVVAEVMTALRRADLPT